MMVRLPTFATYPGSTIVTLGHALPKTAAEAKRLVRQKNEAARKKREADDRAHQKRQAELEEQIRKNREAAGTLRSAHPSGSGRRRGPRLDVSAVYRGRREATEAKATATTTPRRPRTMRDLAASYYGTPSGGDGQLIPAGSRGGAR